MQTQAQNTQQQAHPPGGVNPFARALAEAKSGAPADPNAQDNKSQDLQSTPQDGQSLFDQERHQKDMLEKQRYQRMRAELHRQVNPVSQEQVFNANRERVKREVEEVRRELLLLSQEVRAFEKDIDMTLAMGVPDAGQEGTYHLSFFQKLREFITLLRKKIHSARTWAHTFQSKKGRQQGLNFKAKGAKKTQNVYDAFANNERAVARAGG